MTHRPTHSLRSRRSLPAFVLTGAALASLVACGGDDGDGDASAGGDFSVAAALGELPESALEDDYVITAGDMVRAAELAGATRPASGSDDEDAIFDWATSLQGIIRPDGGEWPPVAVQFPEATNPEWLAQIGEFRDELGWTVLDVDSFVEVSAPPARFTVLQGDFDVDAIDAAIDSNDDDVWSIGEEDFSIDPSQRSAARPLGESLRLAEQDGALAVSKSTPPIEDWAGDGDRVDDESLSAVAEALDEHDVYTAMILDGDSLGFAPPIGGSESPDEVEAQLEEQLGQLPVPFEVLGAGLTVVDGEAVGVLAYAHSSEDAAEQNAGRLEQIFADGASLQTNEPLSSMFVDVEVAVDGTTVTVTFGFDDERPARTLWQAILVRELFASHA